MQNNICIENYKIFIVFFFSLDFSESSLEAIGGAGSFVVDMVLLVSKLFFFNTESTTKPYFLKMNRMSLLSNESKEVKGGT